MSIEDFFGLENKIITNGTLYLKVVWLLLHYVDEGYTTTTTELLMWHTFRGVGLSSTVEY